MKSGIFLKSLLALALASCSMSAMADCTAVTAPSQLPQRIERGQCFEVAGDLTLPKEYEVSGRLIVKAGFRLATAPDSKLKVRRGGQITVRGTMVTGKGSALSLDLTTELINQGELHVAEDSRVELLKSATLKSAGALTVYPDALITLADNSKLSLSATTVVDNAIVSLKGGALENRGTLTLSAGARLMLAKNATLSNQGRFTLMAGSAAELQGSAQLSNRRNVDNAGLLHFSDTAAFVNYGILDIAQGGTLALDGGASMSNQHAFTVDGAMLMGEHSSFENRSGMKIRKDGSLMLKGAARLVNRGSVQQGGTFETRGDAVLVNKKYFFDERTQESLPRVDDAHR